MLIKHGVDTNNNFLSFSLRYAVDIGGVVRIIAILVSWLCPRQPHTR